jgi:chromosomal replication initiator protein
MDDYKEICDTLKEGIRLKLEKLPSVFYLWFNDMSLSSLTEDKAVFTTKTVLKKKVLSTKYIDMISDTLTEIIGFPVEVVIEADLESEEKKTKEEPEKESAFSTDSLEKSAEQEKKIENLLASTDTSKRSMLDDYTFENFIEGSSNKFAKAACFAVAKEPCSYNPLFIYGHSGLGKTHLLYAIMNEMRQNNPELKIVYKKSETFINELIGAIGSNNTAAFKDKYRSADVLLIDDIQFIAGKESTQEEFFHTFSALYEAEKQIILTSDRPPIEIKPLTDRLRTRFEGGLLADVQPPSFELRTAIIRQKSDAMGLTISNDLVDYMAERLNNNIRQIEGILKRLYAISSLSGEEITKEKINQIISIVDPGNIPTDALIERVISVVTKKYGITPDDVKSRKRTDNVANARHICIYIIRQLTELSLGDIGKIFSRDHSTAIASIEKVNINIKTVRNYETDLNRLIKEIKDN